MSPPSFSIIVPCYRQAHFLPQALESALAQHGAAYEVIVVDDGSPDDTAAVAGHFVASHPERVRLVRQENRGLAAARAAGLAVAAGDFLVFLDADDILEPDMLGACVRGLAREPEADVVVGNAWFVGPDGRQPAYPYDQACVPTWPAMLDDNPWGSVVAVVPRTAAVHRVGGLAVEGLRACEDWDLWIRMIRSRARVVTVPERLGRTRMVAGSLSRDPSLMLDTRIKVLEWCTGVDPRLARVDAVEPPIDRSAYARLRNGAVFNALGLALGVEVAPQVTDAILQSLIDGALDADYCLHEFTLGLSHVRGPGPRRRRRTRPLPRRAIAAALRAAGLPALGRPVMRRLDRVLNPHHDPRLLWGTIRWRFGRLLTGIAGGRD